MGQKSGESVLYNLWTCIAREAFPEFQSGSDTIWFAADVVCDVIYVVDIMVQFRTGYLERGLVVYDSTKLALILAFLGLTECSG